MIRGTVKVLRNDFPKLVAGVPTAVGRAVAETMVEVETGAKSRCPVDTGNLRNSITGQMQSPTAAVVGTGPQAPYGVYVHEGARGRAGRPFLRQAVEAVRPRWAQRITAALKGLV